MTVSTERYSTGAIIIHWLTAALMIFMLFFGEDLIKAPRGSNLADLPLASMHATFGILILLLTVLRLVWILAKPQPAKMPGLKRWEVILSKSVQGLFYILLVALPITGWLALTPYGAEHTGVETVKLFKLLPIPAAPNLGEWIGEVHEIGSKLGIALLALHVLGALKHQFIGKLPILRRMGLF